MKKIVLVTMACASLLSACRKNGVEPTPTVSKGTPMPKGTPIGNPILKTIGTSGGSLSTTDGAMTVIVPAGAVSANTEFSIQPITNTTPNGIGNGYLLMPEGKHFEKPVTIQFSYTNDQIDGTMAEELLIAYQDTTGIWYAKLPQLDTIKKTVSVSSDHFSRWGVFANTELVVDKPSIDHKETAVLSVLNVIKEAGSGDYLKLSEGQYVPIDAQQPDFTVSNWSVLGGGNIVAKESNASYTAPANDPSPNPVTVSVLVKDDMIAALNSKNPSVTLKRKIYVHSTYLELVMDGQTNIYPEATIEVHEDVNPTYMYLTGHNSKGNGGVFVLFGKGPGIYQWGADKSRAGGDLDISIGGVKFSDLIISCDSKIETTTGNVQVTKWAEAGAYVEGTIEGTIVNWGDCKSYYYKSITGRFKAKRSS